jgi:ribonuclease HI
VAKKEVKVKAPCTQQKAWIPPPARAVKVNTDAAVARNNGSGVIVAVARSDAGEYLGSLAVLVEGISDPEVLEVMAV